MTKELNLEAKLKIARSGDLELIAQKLDPEFIKEQFWEESFEYLAYKTSWLKS